MPPFDTLLITIAHVYTEKMKRDLSNVRDPGGGVSLHGLLIPGWCCRLIAWNAHTSLGGCLIAWTAHTLGAPSLILKLPSVPSQRRPSSWAATPARELPWTSSYTTSSSLGSAPAKQRKCTSLLSSRPYRNSSEIPLNIIDCLLSYSLYSCHLVDLVWWIYKSFTFTITGSVLPGASTPR